MAATSLAPPALWRAKMCNLLLRFSWTVESVGPTHRISAPATQRSSGLENHTVAYHSACFAYTDAENLVMIHAAPHVNARTDWACLSSTAKKGHGFAMQNSSIQQHLLSLACRHMQAALRAVSFPCMLDLLHLSIYPKFHTPGHSQCLPYLCAKCLAG